MRGCAGLGTIGVVGIAVALVALAMNGGFGAGSPQSVPAVRPAGAAFASDLGAVGVDVRPSNATLAAGETVELDASWTALPTGCVLSPLAWRWAAVAGSVAGSLSSNVGPVTSFSAASGGVEGTAQVELRALSVARCGAGESLLDRTAIANLTVFAAPQLSALHVAPDPIGPGESSNVTGEIALGRPPYSLAIEWGDGTASNYTLAVAGPFSFSHVYPAGNFSPAVAVTDDLGQGASAAPGEMVYVRAGLAVGIEASSYAAEVGRPIEFTGEIQDPPSWFNVSDGCSELGSAAPLAGRSAEPEVTFSCTFDRPGNGMASYSVTPGATGTGTVSAGLEVPVAGPLAMAVSVAEPVGSAGSIVEVPLTISGGVPPFTVLWNASSGGTLESLTSYRDGTVVLPVAAGPPGPLGLTARARDAVGGATTLNVSLGTVTPAIAGTAAVASDATTSGANVTVVGTVTGGTPPFLWYVLPSLTPPNGTAVNGTLAGSGGFLWHAILPAEGSSNATVGAIDAVGDQWQSALELPLVPALSANATVAVAGCATSGLALELNLTIDGGLPPFSVRVAGPVGTAANFTASTDGEFERCLTTNGAGPATLTVQVSDRLGIQWSDQLTIVLPGGGTGPVGSPNGSGPPDPRPPAHPPHDPPVTAPTATAEPAPPADSLALNEAAVLIGVLVGLAGLAAVILRRRRQRTTESTPAPDPRSVVRRILEPADGADRATVELLAEEEGVPLSLARETIDRLVAEGLVRSDTGSDGEEVLAWSDDGRP